MTRIIEKSYRSTLNDEVLAALVARKVVRS
jgi:hypothetical protein